MFNAMRAKLVALAAFAASLVRGDEGSNGPEVTHHKDPSFRYIKTQRPRAGRARAGHELPYGHCKLAKRFIEAGSRGPRGY